MTTKRSRIVVASLALCLAVVPLSACGIQATGNVSVAKKTVSIKSTSYVSEDDIDLVATLAKLSGESVDKKTINEAKSQLDELDKVTINGKEYYTSSDPAKGLQSSTKFTKSQLADAATILDNDKLVMYSLSSDSILNMMGDGDTMMSALKNMKPQDYIDFLDYELTFDKTPIAANGTIEGKKVAYDNLKHEYLWAAFTNKPLKAKASSIKPTVKNKAFTKKDYVTFKTPGIISGYVVDGKKVKPGAVLVDNGFKLNTVAFAKQGKHKVTVKLSNKAKKKFTFTYDKGKPKANVKAKKSYKAGKKLTVTDKYGLKSVKLDGKKVKLASKGKKATAKLKKAGSHKLVATDKAGNKLTVKFKVK